MKRSAPLKTKNVLNSSENFEETSSPIRLDVFPLPPSEKMIVNINSRQPDVIKMEKIFGVNTSLFNDVKHLKEATALNGFLFAREPHDKIHKIFAVHNFKFTDQDFH